MIEVDQEKLVIFIRHSNRVQNYALVVAVIIPAIMFVVAIWYFNNAYNLYGLIVMLASICVLFRSIDSVYLIDWETLVEHALSEYT